MVKTPQQRYFSPLRVTVKKHLCSICYVFLSLKAEARIPRNKKFIPESNHRSYQSLHRHFEHHHGSQLHPSGAKESVQLRDL